MIIKGKKLIFILLFFLIFACKFDKSRLEKAVSVSNEEIPIDTTRKTMLQDYYIDSCEDLMLEVTTSRFGMTSPKGKVIDIRILKNGEAEYDQYKVGLTQSPIIRNQMTFSKSQLDSFRKILNSKEIINSKSKYIGDYYCCDVFIEKKISFCLENKRKDILVSEYDIVIHENRNDKIPQDIVDLLRAIDTITDTTPPSILE